MLRERSKINNKHLVIIALLGLLSALGPFSIDMYLPAFNNIATNLNTSLDAVQLSLASYFIGISIGQLFYGPITDKYGRKKPLYVGMVLYILAAIGCSFAADINQLVFFRFLQALGGCAGMVVSRAVVRDLFHADESAKVYSMLMLVMGVAPIIAPTIGGLVTVAWGWRAIFLTLTFISTFILICMFWLLPETKRPDKTIQLNALAIFKRYALLFKIPSFINYAMCGAFASASMFAYISSAPFIYINIFGFSEESFGIMFSINAAGLILCSQLNRVLLKKYSMKFLLHKATLALMCIGALLFIGVILQTSPYFFITLIFIFVSLLGFIYPNSTALALAETHELTGTASALLGALQMFVSAGAAALVSIFFNATLFPVSLIIVLTSTCTFAYYLKHHKQKNRLTAI